MKYYDENGVEIPESEIDYAKGRVEYKSKVIAHHPATEAQPEKNHYEVSKFYFDDGTSYTVTSPDDPHIEFINPEEGVFGYIDLGEGKTLFGIDLKTVVDEPATEAKEAYDETEDYYVYIPYTPEELAEQAEQQKKAEAQAEFLTTGPERLESTEISVDDLCLVVAELVGME